MNTHIKPFLFAATATALLLSAACNDDDDDGPTEPVNEEELITTVTVNYGGNSTMTFRDIDGPGGDDPVITGATLQADTTYRLTTSFLNESATPAEDITAEVEEEGAEHQVFYRTTGFDAEFTYEDADSLQQPLGLVVDFVTGEAGTGELEVTLRHQPNKGAAGVAGGDIANAGGETDVQVTFPVTIE